MYCQKFHEAKTFLSAQLIVDVLSFLINPKVQKGSEKKANSCIVLSTVKIPSPPGIYLKLHLYSVVQATASYTLFFRQK